MTLSSRLRVSLTAERKDVLDLATTVTPLSVVHELVTANGVGAGKANLIWHDQRTLTASSTENLDLAFLSATPFSGNTILKRITGILVYAAPTNINNVVLGAHASAAWAGLLNAAGTITVRPGGFFSAGSADAIGHAVVASTGDQLKVANSGSGSSVVYDIVIIGSDA